MIPRELESLGDVGERMIGTDGLVAIVRTGSLDQDHRWKSAFAVWNSQRAGQLV